jgi:hypothetical protein
MPLASLLERIGLRLRAIATTPPAPIMTSQGSGAIPTGPVPGSKPTTKFFQEIGRLAYVWPWPLVNVFNRSLQPLLRQTMAYPHEGERLARSPRAGLEVARQRGIALGQPVDFFRSAAQGARCLPAAPRRGGGPPLEFRNFGVPLPHNWTTVINSAEFGTDYYTRTAVAKSNIFINRPRETRYFYQDLEGARLNGHALRRHLQTHSPRQRLLVDHPLRPVPFLRNEINRYSLGTKRQGLNFAPDGSLTILVQKVQKEKPAADKVANWLPAPAGDFSLYIRAYWPLDAIQQGQWTPPPVIPA